MADEQGFTTLRTFGRTLVALVETHKRVDDLTLSKAAEPATCQFGHTAETTLAPAGDAIKVEGAVTVLTPGGDAVRAQGGYVLFTTTLTPGGDAVVALEDFHGVTGNERYELHVGTDLQILIDELVAGSRTPQESWAPPLAHSTTYVFPEECWAVVQYFSKYDLGDLNVRTHKISHTGGAGLIPRPSVPQSQGIKQIAGSKFEVTASYYPPQDDPNPATKWLLYLTLDGTDPTLAAAIESAMTTIRGGSARLTHITATQIAGTLIRVRIKTRRVDAGPINRDSDFSDEMVDIIPAFAPQTPTGLGIAYPGEY